MLKTLQNLEASNNREQKLVQIRHFLFSFSSVEQNIMNLTAVRCVFSLSFPKSEKSFSLHNKFHPRKDTRRHTDAITESASLSTSFSRSSSSSTSSSSFLLLFWFAFRRYSGFVRSVTKTKKKILRQSAHFRCWLSHSSARNELNIDFFLFPVDFSLVLIFFVRFCFQIRKKESEKKKALCFLRFARKRDGASAVCFDSFPKSK